MKPKKTIHHQVAQSIGGSNEDSNKILIPEDLHTNWHHWTGNLAPTDAARFIMLLSIGWEEGNIDHQLMRYYFRTSIKSTLDELYVRSSLETVTSLDGLAKAHSAIKHRIRHLRLEEIVTHRTQQALRGKAQFPAKIYEEFPIAFLNFFNTEDPLTAFKRLFTFKYGKERALVKPLKSSIRKAILINVLNAKKGKQSLSKERQNLSAVLDKHKTNVKRKKEQLERSYYRTVKEKPSIGLPSILWSLEKALLEEG